MSELAKFRDWLAGSGFAAFIVGTEDSHQSEYVSAHDMRREFISKFTGSAGTAVITAKEALLWTDGRYFVQAEQQLSSDWTLMRMFESGVPSLEEWLAELPTESKVGVDSTLISINASKRLRSAMTNSGVKIEYTEVGFNPIDQIWEDQPPPPSKPLVVHPLEYAGKTSLEKVIDLREELKKLKCGSIIIASVDECMWLLNVRGSDVDYNPVALSYVVVTQTDTTLYIDQSKVGPETAAHLSANSVVVRPYGDIYAGVKEVVDSSSSSSSSSSPASKILCDGNTVSQAIANIIPADLVENRLSPIQVQKAVKNAAELKGLRDCHVRDGAAVTAWLAWLEDSIREGKADGLEWPLTEVTAADKLEEFRSKLSGYVGLSFPTIAGYGPNGAIIHYKPETDQCAKLEIPTQDSSPSSSGPLCCDAVDRWGMFLVDSGGQYRDGTTDITRTVHLPFKIPDISDGKDDARPLKKQKQEAGSSGSGDASGGGDGYLSPRAKQREVFTLVLKGYLQLAMAKFPYNTLGSRLDSFARLPLWKAGLEYKHGTGHGIGAYLNVHEGPQSITFRARDKEVGFRPGMTISNEPGYYETGGFGVRIESILVCVPDNDVKYGNSTSSGGGSGEKEVVSGFCKFETITMVPIQQRLVEVSMLDDTELAWINGYHAAVRKTLEPHLSDNPLALAYLAKETEPMTRQ